MELIKLVQDSGLGVWSRESNWALFAYLIVHAVSMGLTAGVGVLIALRALGVAGRAPARAFKRFLPLMGWLGLIALISGVLLLAAYPAKALTNVVFYVKLVMAASGFVLTVALARGLGRWPGAAARTAAVASLALWAGAVTTGRLLAYTHNMLLAY